MTALLRLLPPIPSGAVLVTCWRCLADHDMASDGVRQDGPRGADGDFACTDFDACAERAAANDQDDDDEMALQGARR